MPVSGGVGSSERSRLHQTVLITRCLSPHFIPHTARRCLPRHDDNSLPNSAARCLQCYPVRTRRRCVLLSCPPSKASGSWCQANHSPTRTQASLASMPTAAANHAPPRARAQGSPCHSSCQLCLETFVRRRCPHGSRGLLWLPPPPLMAAATLLWQVPRCHLFDGVDPTVAAAFDQAISCLRAAGAHVVEKDAPELTRAQADDRTDPPPSESHARIKHDMHLWPCALPVPSHDGQPYPQPHPLRAAPHRRPCTMVAGLQRPSRGMCTVTSSRSTRRSTTLGWQSGWQGAKDSTLPTTSSWGVALVIHHLITRLSRCVRLPRSSGARPALPHYGCASLPSAIVAGTQGRR